MLKCEGSGIYVYFIRIQCEKMKTTCVVRESLKDPKTYMKKETYPIKIGENRLRVSRQL